MGQLDLVHLAQAGLQPVITVYTNPVDSTAHPTYPEGWFRWAVHIGGRPVCEQEWVMQAGIEEHQPRAAWAGEFVGAACVNALRAMGIPAGFASVALDYDPVPAGMETVKQLRRDDE